MTNFNTTEKVPVEWQPTANNTTLVKRAEIMEQIRAFFKSRGVLEVETPLMSQAGVTDLHLHSFSTRFVGPGASQGLPLYLITSPEYSMKRLLAAGSGPIFQICKCFRNEEAGRYHNPEFTMLEWYRPFFTMLHLINEVDDLLQEILNCKPAQHLSYQHAMQKHLDIDPLSASLEVLQNAAVKLGMDNFKDEQDRDTLLQLLFSFGVEPKIGLEQPVVVYHFPASQAALAKINPADHRVAERFEFYFKGVELANGFHELTDAKEQKLRFEEDNQRRINNGLPEMPVDQYLLAALEHGMPETSGVALGLDRLIMLALNKKSLQEVMSFPVSTA